MRAVGIIPKTSRLELLDVAQPAIQLPGQVLLKILQVGVCGTDREIAHGEIGAAPPDVEHLIIGHEMLGQIAAVGAGVQGFREGDLVVATVRRGCGRCPSCLHGAVDFCTTGDYIEHGIKQLNGFMTEYVVDSAEYLVPLPAELRAIGVLLEPLSVGEKAIEQALRVLRRLPQSPGHPERAMDASDWGVGIRALVAGSGPIGMLGAMILRAHGAEVTVVDRADEDAFSSSLISAIGARHINGAAIETENIDDQLGQVDMIFEATGAAEFSFKLIDALGANGVYVMTGVPGGDQQASIPAASLMRQIVLNNQVLFGSVNASKQNFVQGVADLARFRALWGDTADRLITERVPLERYMDAIEAPEKGGIKSIVEIAA
jgi:threonine dehydrogenase-like Zn-dependent dehydrogenase